MASMVVLSAMAAVEVRMPNQEVEVIVNQLRTDCTLLLSDREGPQVGGCYTPPTSHSHSRKILTIHQYTH